MDKASREQLHYLAEEMLKLLKKITEEDEAESSNNVSWNDTAIVLDKYISEFQGGPFAFHYDSVSGSVVEEACWYHASHDNPFCQYLSEDYARHAVMGKMFLDACLAFKWCYDADYNPVWPVTDVKSGNWYVSYNHLSNKFEVNVKTATEDLSVIYFSSEAIARKCADWLNFSWKNKEAGQCTL